MFQPASETPTLAVIDQGSLKTKLATEFMTDSYLSVHAPLTKGNMLGNLSYIDVVRIDDDPTWWVFGEKMIHFADLSRVNHIASNARYYGPAYRRGMGYALFRTHCHLAPSKETYEPICVVSVPALEYKRNKLKIEGNIAGRYKVVAMCDGKERTYRFRVTLDNLNVIPEGAGTLYDYLRAEEEGMIETDFSHEAVAIASWGYYTLSIVIFQGGMPVGDATDSNNALGMGSVAEEIFQQLGIEPGADIEAIDKQMQGDSMKINGYEIPDFKAIKQAAIDRTIDQALDWLQMRIKRSRLSVGSLIFVGGTAESVWPHMDLEHRANRDLLPAQIIKVVDAPREDADGAFRYFWYMMNRGI